jgi:hypothetical protein
VRELAGDFARRAHQTTMIHYHGGRHSTWQVAVEIWERRHALVSHADPQQIVVASEVAQSFALDNGAFSVWKQGVEANWLAYYEWVDQWRRHPGFDWAVIPDVIEGDEAANDALLAQWPFSTSAGVPVWHFHESLERLSRLANRWPRIALGSSAQFATPATASWWGRMQQIMETVCTGDGKPMVKLHGLRMLNPRIVEHVPLASADSAYVSRKVGLPPPVRTDCVRLASLSMLSTASALPRNWSGIGFDSAHTSQKYVGVLSSL